MLLYLQSLYGQFKNYLERDQEWMINAIKTVGTATGQIIYIGFYERVALLSRRIQVKN